MPEIIKKNWDITLILGIGLILTIAGLLGMSGVMVIPSSVSAATTATATVSVSATVNEWMTFSVSPSSVTLQPALVSITGATSIGSSTSNITINIGTNASSGWSTTIKGANNGLATGTNSIASVADGATASTTLSAGIDGYGANATNSASGATIDPRYNKWTTNTVASIRTGGQTLVSTTTPHAAADVALAKIYAAADAVQAAGTYTDTVTFTITTSP